MAKKVKTEAVEEAVITETVAVETTEVVNPVQDQTEETAMVTAEAEAVKEPFKKRFVDFCKSLAYKIKGALGWTAIVVVTVALLIYMFIVDFS